METVSKTRPKNVILIDDDELLVEVNRRDVIKNGFIFECESDAQIYEAEIHEDFNKKIVISKDGALVFNGGENGEIPYKVWVYERQNLNK